MGCICRSSWSRSPLTPTPSCCRGVCIAPSFVCIRSRVAASQASLPRRCHVTSGRCHVSRFQRRKAQTRRKLVDAALAMLADGRAQTATIQDITEAPGPADQRCQQSRAPFAGSVRLLVRLTPARRDIAQILVDHGMAHIDSDRSLAPRVLRNGIGHRAFPRRRPRLARPARQSHASSAGQLRCAQSRSSTKGP
ncbi:MAG: hypothetical protein ACLPQY_27825 [Streptosporangiaceae bacterium]